MINKMLCRLFAARYSLAYCCNNQRHVHIPVALKTVITKLHWGVFICFFISSGQARRVVKNSMHSADCNTDHVLVLCRRALRTRKFHVSQHTISLHRPLCNQRPCQNEATRI